jgi:hypothetical protein
MDVFCTHKWSTYYVNKQQRKRRGEDVSVLGANDAAGLNVTVWELGRVSKRGKMSHRDNMSQDWKRNIMKQVGKMSQSGCLVTIQVKKGGCFVTATEGPPLWTGGCKISGLFEKSQWTK